jgi:hypothetical protein
MVAKSIVAVVALLAGFTAAQSSNTTINIGALPLTMKGQFVSVYLSAQRIHR